MNPLPFEDLPPKREQGLLMQNPLPSVLAYWREFDHYLIPVWPTGKPPKTPRPAVDLNDRVWDQVRQRILEHQPPSTKPHKQVQSKFALQVFFQCYFAHSLLGGRQRFYKKPPKLYLAAGLVTFEIKDDKLTAALVNDPDQWVMNYPLLHQLFLKFGHFLSKTKDLSLWYTESRERLVQLASQEWSQHFQDDSLNSIANLKSVLDRINHVLVADLWAHPEVAAFMREHDSVYLLDTDSVEIQPSNSNGSQSPFFEWWWLETEEATLSPQLGPFFSKDLAWVKKEVEQGRISSCLKDYLLGRTDVAITPSHGIPQDLAEVLSPANPMLGKWPSNPAHALTTMQAYAHRVFMNHGGLCAVNGPPGTGKTTLLKDAIADLFVRRTEKLIEAKKLLLEAENGQKEWYAYQKNHTPEVPFVLDHAIVIASSNNTAVENISKELPSLGEIDPRFRERIRHFGKSESTWGIFCAVLGKSKNRQAFYTDILEPVQNHLNNLKDPLRLQHFANCLKSEQYRSLSEIIQCWYKEDCTTFLEVMAAYPSLAGLRDLVAAKGSEREVKAWFGEHDEKQKVCRDVAKIATRFARKASQDVLSLYRDSVQEFCSIKASLEDHYRWFAELGTLTDDLVRDRADYEMALTQVDLYADQFLALTPEDLCQTKRSQTQKSLEELQGKVFRLGKDKTRSEMELALLERDLNLFQKQNTLQNFFSFGFALVGFISRALRKIHDLKLELVRCEEERSRLQSDLQKTKGELRRLEHCHELGQKRTQLEGICQSFLQKKKAKKNIASKLGNPPSLDTLLLTKRTLSQKNTESDRDYYQRVQTLEPWSCESINELQSLLFIASLKVNQKLIELSASKIAWALKELKPLLDGTIKKADQNETHRELWSLFFLCFPVVSTTYASAEKQFKHLLGSNQLGYLISDESGQSKVYEPVGLLQRCKNALMVGDPRQIEPIVTMDAEIDASLARRHFADVPNALPKQWLVSQSSAQLLADAGSLRKGQLDQDPVGIPLTVHRRCQDPMFSIANSIAYNQMMIQRTPAKNPTLPNFWLDVEPNMVVRGKQYFNQAEIERAWEILQALHQQGQEKVFVITPFTLMADQLRYYFQKRRAETSTSLKHFSPRQHIGTVHTFQGKEAEVVILCLCAGPNQMGGIHWVNQAPNLINVAVTRARSTLIVIGNFPAWAKTDYGRHLAKNLKRVSTWDFPS